ncbi:MAG: phosphatidate cytidylyltransferase [Chitinophagaceae bacterium]
MSFNLQIFKTRTLTAIAFAIIMLAGLLINQFTFFLLFSVIYFGCWIEYQKLVGLIDARYNSINIFHKLDIMLLGWGFMLWNTNAAFNTGNYNLQQIGLWLMLAAFIVIVLSEIIFYRSFSIKNIGYSALGLIYISLSWGLMIRLRSDGMFFSNTNLFIDLGWVTPIVLIASIWINDTMAYIVGSIIGKNSLSKISPKKTWEGTAGGALLAIATVSLVGYFVFDMTDIVSLIVISSIAAIMGTVGDLFESKMKRMAGVKDSGKIMPGHGGFLDRFDSLIFATPFVWLYIKIFL